MTGQWSIATPLFDGLTGEKILANPKHGWGGAFLELSTFNFQL